MIQTSPPTSDFKQRLHHCLRCLTHPLSLLAMVLLTLNDHVWKWAHPSWLTGKLSDIAGLLFFPFLLAVFLHITIFAWWKVSQRIWWLTSISLTALVFTSVQLSASAAQSLGVVFGALSGLPSQFTPDPTDLLTLPILIVTWWVWRTTQKKTWSRSLPLWAWPTLGFSILVSIATSYVKPHYLVCLLPAEGNLYALVSRGELPTGPNEKSWVHKLQKWNKNKTHLCTRGWKTALGGLPWKGSRRLLIRKLIPERWESVRLHTKEHSDIRNVLQPCFACLNKTGWKQGCSCKPTSNEPLQLSPTLQLKPGKGVEILQSTNAGKTWSVAWSIPKQRLDFARRWRPRGSPLWGPWDLAIHPTTKNFVVVALGNEGILVRSPSGTWKRHAVYGSYPTPLQLRNDSLMNAPLAFKEFYLGLLFQLILCFLFAFVVWQKHWFHEFKEVMQRPKVVRAGYVFLGVFVFLVGGLFLMTLDNPESLSIKKVQRFFRFLWPLFLAVGSLFAWGWIAMIWRELYWEANRQGEEKILRTLRFRCGRPLWQAPIVLYISLVGWASGLLPGYHHFLLVTIIMMGLLNLFTLHQVLHKPETK